jgi:hypothetical protein
VRRGGLGLFAAVAMVLSAQPTVLASSATAPGWTKQAPAAHPPPREGASMAYDAATRTVVLFGGRDHNGLPSSTWTWGGPG